MTRIRILPSTLALVGAGMIGGIAGPMIAGAGPDYRFAERYTPAWEAVRVEDRLHLSAGVPVTITVPRLPHPNIDATPAAVAINLTVVDAAADGYLTAYPAGHAQPNVSNVNFTAGQVTTNFAIVPVEGEAFELVSSADVAVIVDLFGAFDKPPAYPDPADLDCTTAVTYPNSEPLADGSVITDPGTGGPPIIIPCD